ncbi:hypothetical protein [Chromobacterium vaccinii]|uniref:hypothetical protein n=1 Tax=Chromobacterium vaccinii TaxID=1108595 RepID=UPI000618230B|nr:hypothetical protein [Chromobacterium vaccinii]
MTTTNKTAIGIRFHRYNDSVKQTVDTLLQSGCFQASEIHLVMDVSSAHALPPRDVIPLSSEKIRSMGLLAIEQYGWHCGDYFLYALREKVKADYYWLIEPDVAFGKGAEKAFFSRMRDIACDYAAFNHTEKDASWAWYKGMRQFSDKVYGSAFPITRCSAKAVDMLYQTRKAHSQQFQDKKLPSHWPNDESFVSTTLENAGLHCIDLHKQNLCYSAKFGTLLPILRHAAATQSGIFHPALSFDEMKAKFLPKLEIAIRSKRVDEFIERATQDMTPQQLKDMLALVVKAHRVQPQQG